MSGKERRRKPGLSGKGEKGSGVGAEGLAVSINQVSLLWLRLVTAGLSNPIPERGERSGIRAVSRKQG